MSSDKQLSSEEQAVFEDLLFRIKTILPEQYQDCYEDVQPVSMGSAGLKYRTDGRVAWDEIWSTFCDLAMAGGPPHKGTLLEPGSRWDVDAQPDAYRRVTEELCRGIGMVTDFEAETSPISGWVRVNCPDAATAGWLLRAIVMENVSARCDGVMLDLPAAPGFRVEKEIKNVITVIAKTCHYWSEHMWAAQQRFIGTLFQEMGVEWPLIQPAFAGEDCDLDTHQALREKMAATIREATGFMQSDRQYAGWLGVHCADVASAIWMMRALVASNVLSRREETTLFLPVNPATDPAGDAVEQSFIRICGFAKKGHPE